MGTITNEDIAKAYLQSNIEPTYEDFLAFSKKWIKEIENFDYRELDIDISSYTTTLTVYVDLKDDWSLMLSIPYYPVEQFDEFDCLFSVIDPQKYVIVTAIGPIQELVEGVRRMQAV